MYEDADVTYKRTWSSRIPKVSIKTKEKAIPILVILALIFCYAALCFLGAHYGRG